MVATDTDSKWENVPLKMHHLFFLWFLKAFEGSLLL